MGIVLLIAVVLVVWTVGPGAAQAADRNIVLFLTDDQSPDAGCYGNPVIKTPNLDRLAAEGVLFPHAFCTTASCSASRSVILTGLHNHANGHYGHEHAYHKFSSHRWVASLPVMLSRLGYRTARIGKHHNAPEDVYYFETKLRGNGRSPVEMADNCRDFIAADDPRPFFLLFASADPHRGGGIVEDSVHRPDRFGNRPPGQSYPGVEEVVYDPDEVVVPPFLPDTATCRAELAQYYQSISRVDQGLGRLMELLKAAGKWDSTLVLFTSDHGMAFPGAKTTVYEGGLRVPFVLRNPYENARGHLNLALVSLIDAAPTLLDFAGGFDGQTGTVVAQAAELVGAEGTEANEPRVHRPYRLHGRSLLPILGQKNPAGWDVVYASHTFHEVTMYYPMRVIRDRHYKFIWNIAHPLPFPFASDLWAASTWQAQYRRGSDAPYGRCTVGEYIHRPKFELFDLQADPEERTNLADNPGLADRMEHYKARLRQFQTETDDPWVLKWDYE
jgi:N-sulfoglucosamine sulfohydrolase